MKNQKSYSGFEQGPIRPPSEAHSLLIRVTRNCPWNRCSFCPVYKGASFSRRPVDHVKRDIDLVHKYVTVIREQAGEETSPSRTALHQAQSGIVPGEEQAFYAAVHWARDSRQSVFLQDANSLVIKSADLCSILTHLRNRFPWIQRVTTYARAQTVSRLSPEDLQALAAAGLNRIHIGMESGSDTVLKLMKKGVTKEQHITAGLKVKGAGMELSEYVMPGLGGKNLWREHALETADTLNSINPDFIRLRSLAIPRQVDLHDWHTSGTFSKCTEAETVREILLFLEHLTGITSTVASDHMLNLLQEVEGVLPGDKPAMIHTLQQFLDLAPEQQMLFIIARRLGLCSRLQYLADPGITDSARKFCRQHGVTPQNVDRVISELMEQSL